ncbi:MAG TPA: D-2-hydroxyacid dehydrogenase [Saprospiraceae bacterium]|nr:D-2-hydroxyacid dehydrogenase [Saprospiraceae bacterium]HMP25894.1 D-2-hydroxyacid dehydrogenase [Saprospiraceae bacterium]
MHQTSPVFITVVDGYTLNPGDLDWQPLAKLGQLSVFDHSTREVLLERARKAHIILANKAPFDADIIRQLPQLRCICVTATGYNNIDILAARERGITVCNVTGYGTETVAQHVFALLLELTNAVGRHHASVRNGDWARARDFCYTLQPIIELSGRTMGIYGFGRIGQQVARIAQAFGMQVLATHKHPQRDAMPQVQFVDVHTLFQQSDVISLHAPLTPENERFINAKLLATMRPHALLINTARGALIHETDLRQALASGQIAGAALDVLAQEPPPPDHPLIGAPHCIVTPHNAWASRAARQRLLNESIANVQAFLNGQPRNVI